MEPLATIWSVSTSIYSTRSLSKEIENIYSSISEVYANIANAHFESSIKAIEASRKSNRPDIEIRDAISHLRDAYHVYKSCLNQTRKEKFLFFISYDSDLIEDKLNFFQRVSRIAAIISIIYNSLEEKHNSETWKALAISDFDKFLELYKPSVAEMEKINDDFVQTVTTTYTTPMWQGDGMPFAEIESSGETEIISYTGRNYIMKKKEYWKKDFMNGLSRKKFKFNQ